MLFSVIVPFYNRSDLVATVLDSIQAQTEKDAEVILIDDGSTDDTWECLNRHPIEAIRLKSENGGAASARNKAVEAARGDYLAFLDSDDLWFPYSLRLYKEVIESEGFPSIVTGKPLIFNQPEKLITPENTTLSYKAFQNYYDSYEEWRWHGVSSFVIKREAFLRAGGFARQRMNAEDADLMLKLGTEPGFIQIMNPPPFAYREHAGNLTLNFDLGYAGIRHLIESEHAQSYPGGKAFRYKRRFIISRHLRPMILTALAAGKRTEACFLFRKSFSWLLREGRLRFIAYITTKLILSRFRTT